MRTDRNKKADPLRGFWNDKNAASSPWVSRPDLVAERNGTTLQIERAKQLTRHRENCDCCVRMVAILANTSYEQAHDALKRNGRKTGGKTMDCQAIDALLDLSVHAVIETDVSARTFRTVEKELIRGFYWIRGHSHSVALIDGVIYDYARGSLSRIKRVYKIEPAPA